MTIQYFCENDRRKRDVLNHPTLNGIDYLEIADRVVEGQLVLPQGLIQLHFLKGLDSEQINISNLRIEGGQRVQAIDIAKLVVKDKLLSIELNNFGDFSTYRLNITAGTGSQRAPDWLDPVLSMVDFSFKVNCPSEFDCAPQQDCPIPEVTEPEIDYLARDYASFRQLMLDRMSVTIPEWSERNPSDLGVAAVEILAYAADHLSYYQDAVSTETYLNTARRRVSVRRHARLLDYVVHEGNNARTWIALEVSEGADNHTLPTHTPFFTGKPDRVIVENPGLKTLQAKPAPIILPQLNCFTLMALDQIVLEEKVHIFHGHIGVVNSVGQSEYGEYEKEYKQHHHEFDDDDHKDDEHEQYSHQKDNAWSLIFAENGHLNDEGFGIFADRIYLGDKTKVQDIYFNQVNDQSGVRGRAVEPLAMPLSSNIPVMPEVSPGDHDVVVNKGRKRTLDAGNYKKLRAYSGAKITLSGGVYHFYAWDIRDKVIITLEGDCEIRIEASLKTSEKVRINHNGQEGNEGKAKLLVYVNGTCQGDEHKDDDEEEYDEDEYEDDDDEDDEKKYKKSKGKKYKQQSKQKKSTVYKTYENNDDCVAVEFGEKNQIGMTLYATGSRIKIEEKTHIVGNLIGRRIKAEKYAKFWLGKHSQSHKRCQIIPRDGGSSEIGAGRNCITELQGNVSVFESMHELTLKQSYNRIEFYTWGDKDCCLPQGATRASLDNHDASLNGLKPGELLLFEEVASINGSEPDADPAHRHIVRLTDLEFVTDPLYEDRQVVKIAWSQADALPFALCLKQVEIENPSASLGDEGLQENGKLLRSMSLARGNVLLADHGRSFCDQPLLPDTVPEFGRYRPRLSEPGTTYRVAHSQQQLNELPASGLLHQDPRKALPAIELNEDDQQIWLAQPDLLNSDRFAAEFVTESEDDGRTFIRFGDNVLGRRPMSGSQFSATYRVGNGLAGNVGAESITHLALAEGEASVQAAITRVRNPLAASGGCEAESIENVKLFAPQAFRSQQRTVTLADYVSMAQSHPEVQKAEASQRWTGSWYTVFLTIDRKQGLAVNAEFEKALRAYLEPLRTMGHELEITPPRLAPLDIALRVCVAPGFLRSEVKAALFEVFSSGQLNDGRSGFFHPDNWTFGQSVYASTVIETAMAVAGVSWVELQRFQRKGGLAVIGEIPTEIRMARLEIARLDNDPNAPENGRIEFNMEGGL